MDNQPLDHTLVLMRMEYLEMPDLKLTRLQARRLWNLSQELCDAALTALVGSGFLWRTTDGMFLRRGLGRSPGTRRGPSGDAPARPDPPTDSRAVPRGARALPEPI